MLESLVLGPCDSHSIDLFRESLRPPLAETHLFRHPVKTGVQDVLNNPEILVSGFRRNDKWIGGHWFL